MPDSRMCIPDSHVSNPHSQNSIPKHTFHTVLSTLLQEGTTFDYMRCKVKSCCSVTIQLAAVILLVTAVIILVTAVISLVAVVIILVTAVTILVTAVAGRQPLCLEAAARPAQLLHHDHPQAGPPSLSHQQ